jgi:outer membrane protein OmpA-like peptidoglycan-associated protein
MMKLFLIFLLLINFQAYSEQLRFKFQTGQKQRIECTIEGKQYIDSQLTNEYYQNYKTISIVENVAGNNAICKDEYVYFIDNKINEDIKQFKEITTITYSRDQLGRMTARMNQSLPTIRNAPVFPEKSVQPGDTWEIPATEVQDIFGDKFITVFPLKVRYTYLSDEELDNRKVAKILYEFQFDIINNKTEKIHPKIARAIGISKTTMYFDNKTGNRIKEDYSRSYAFQIINGNSSALYELVDAGTRIWYPVELMNKDEIINELNRELKDKKIEDAKVEKDDRGIKLSLENIHFHPDSDEPLPEEEKRINQIADIIRKYKERGVLIIGHAASTGDKEGEQELSVQRAKKIIDKFNQLQAINPEKSSYSGMGSDEPVADNNTETGRKKNRRVEIFILEE